MPRGPLHHGCRSRGFLVLPSQIACPSFRIQRSVGSGSCRLVLPASLYSTHGNRRVCCRGHNQLRQLRRRVPQLSAPAHAKRSLVGFVFLTGSCNGETPEKSSSQGSSAPTKPCPHWSACLAGQMYRTGMSGSSRLGSPPSSVATSLLVRFLFC